MVAPLLVKLAAPALATALGAGGLAYAATHDSPVPGAAAVWVDDPLSGSRVGVGVVSVTAHASSPADLGALELVVDGAVVATDSDLERNERLLLATFAWDAAAGTHEVVVRVPGGVASGPVTVTVRGGGPVPTPTASPRPTPAVTSATPTPTPTPTPTVTPTMSPSPVPTSAPPSPTTPATTTTPPRPTPRPTTASPTPTLAPPAYRAGTATLPQVYWDQTQSGITCPAGRPRTGTATLQADRASTAVLVVGGASFPLTRSGSTFSGTVDTRQVPGGYAARRVPVSVLLTGPGGQTSTSLGDLFIDGCSKD